MWSLSWHKSKLHVKDSEVHDSKNNSTRDMKDATMSALQKDKYENKDSTHNGAYK